MTTLENSITVLPIMANNDYSINSKYDDTTYRVHVSILDPTSLADNLAKSSLKLKKSDLHFINAEIGLDPRFYEYDFNYQTMVKNGLIGRQEYDNWFKSTIPDQVQLLRINELATLHWTSDELNQGEKIISKNRKVSLSEVLASPKKQHLGRNGTRYNVIGKMRYLYYDGTTLIPVTIQLELPETLVELNENADEKDRNKLVTSYIHYSFENRQYFDMLRMVKWLGIMDQNDKINSLLPLYVSLLKLQSLHQARKNGVHIELDIKSLLPSEQRESELAEQSLERIIIGLDQMLNDSALPYLLGVYKNMDAKQKAFFPRRFGKKSL